ncbi:MAG: hypothetical protein Q4D79_11265 [Propionibacteriaceae bacterium]|nr:hypothetical protein [Propionibacteriaceae bacterium]
MTHPLPPIPRPRRCTRQFLATLLVLLALVLGSWGATLLPTRDEVSEAPFLRHGDIGEGIRTRLGTVTVTGVRTSARIQRFNQVAASAGLWIVVDLDFVPAEEVTTLANFQLKDPMDRTFGGAQVLPAVCGPAQPGFITSCMIHFEVPQESVPGATLWVRNSRPGFPDDVAVIDLELDSSSQDVDAAADPIVVEEPVTRGQP